MSYFAIERNGNTWDHITITDHDGNVVFTNYLDMSYDEMKSQDDLEDFVIAIMEATNVEVKNDDEQTIVTLIGDDDIFIWSVIMGPGEDDSIQYVLVDWKKDGHNYRYEN